MRLTNISEVEEFLHIIDRCEGNVILTSIYGDRYNLKSKLNRYLAPKLFEDHGDELELWCESKNDEALFFKFFNKYPETL